MKPFGIFILHMSIVLITPIFAIGLINRTKAIWAGRKGPTLNQFFFDLRRLVQKFPVTSEVSSWIFQLAPWVILATSLAAAFLAPIMPGYSPVSFPYDFIYFAYLIGIGRGFLILGALDTGSAFEGMGASREATYSALIEPALFLSIGTLGILSGHTSFQDLISRQDPTLLGWLIKIFLVATLFILLQIETARVPVDDPNTHLELTMIHEVMILDNSGPGLAAIQYGATLKFVTLAGLIASILNPFSVLDNVFLSCAVSIGIMAGLSVITGLFESLMARFRFRTLPIYAGLGVLTGFISLFLGVVSRLGAI